MRLAESDGKAELRASFVPIKGNGYDWVTTLAENAVANQTGTPLVGISLYGAAAGEDRTRPDGSYGPVADLIRPTSGDVVTNAGAGGKFVRRLMESARAKRAAHNPQKGSAMKLDELKGKLVESAKRLREAGTDEAARTKALDELDTLAKTEVEAPEPKLDGLTAEKLQESAPALYSTIRESAKAEVQIPATAPEADEKLRSENEQLKGTLLGLKVLRESEIPAEKAEKYLERFRESNITTEAGMKAVIDRDKELIAEAVQQVQSAGLDGLGFVEGNPGRTDDGDEGLLELPGVPKPEKETTTTAAAA